MKEQTLDAWHFTGPALRDGTLLPEDGRTLRIDGEPKLCARGYHASKRALDALKYASGTILCRVRLSGQIIEDSDKAVATERTVLWRVDGEALLRRFARRCALDVIELWEAPDVVRDYLRTGREDLRAAARDAASVDAWGAAEGAAAKAAAYDAAKAAFDTSFAASAAASATAWHAAEDAARADAFDAASAADVNADWHAAYAAADAAEDAARAAAYNAASAADVNADWHAAWRAAWHAAARAAARDPAMDAADAAARTRQERRLRAMIHAERRSTE